MKIKVLIVLSLLFAQTSLAVTPLWTLTSRGDAQGVRSYVDSILLELVGMQGSDEDFIAYNNALESLMELASDPNAVLQEVDWEGRRIDDGHEAVDQEHSEIREFAALNLNRRNERYSAAVSADSVRHASLSAIRHLLLFGFPAAAFFEHLERRNEEGATPLLQFLNADRLGGVRLMLALGANFETQTVQGTRIFRNAMLLESTAMRRLFLISLLDRLLHGHRVHPTGFLLMQNEANNLLRMLELYQLPLEAPQVEIPQAAAPAPIYPLAQALPAMHQPLNPNAVPFVPRTPTWGW